MKGYRQIGTSDEDLGKTLDERLIEYRIRGLYEIYAGPPRKGLKRMERLRSGFDGKTQVGL